MTAPAVEPRPKPTDAQRADITRARNAAVTALVLFPGPIGDLLSGDLNAWAEYGWRIGHGRILPLIADIENRYAALAAERTYG